MRVIICGAGRVGLGIAKYLAIENFDICLIDESEELLRNIEEKNDLKTICGCASHPETLLKAEANKADAIIAVTRSDEINMLACTVAHNIFNVPKKIARIRNPSYHQPEWSSLFGNEGIPVDFVISPEYEIAQILLNNLNLAGAFDVQNLHEMGIQLVGVKCIKGSKLLNNPLSHLSVIVPDLPFKVIALNREGDCIIPKPEDCLYENDEIYFIAHQDHVHQIMAFLGYKETETKRVVVLGGGSIGFTFIKKLEEEYPKINSKIIEFNKKRAEEIAAYLKKTVVIHGDALDTSVLLEANAHTADIVISVTNDDKVNVLSSLLVKSLGVSRTFSLINNPIYRGLGTNLSIDSIIDPKMVTVSTILRHIGRVSNVKSLYSLFNGFAEIIEAHITEGSDVVGTNCQEIADRHMGLPVLIIRKGEFIFPDASVFLHNGDILYLVIEVGHIANLSLISPQYDYMWNS